ncbi:MAG: trypsin-like peptidase domain-containing protein [Deltaproteobacteria bacterium]|nr:trypsin-like peptidase domain-containing protein [Deltaproteobacteria bacterium]
MNAPLNGWTSKDISDADRFAADLFGTPVTRRHSFAPPARPTESVIGTDDRFQVRARPNLPSTLLYPFNTICLVQDADPTVPNGSGFLIAPRVMLTAKHVLVGFGPQTVTPGADLSASTAANQRPAAPASQTLPTASIRPHATLDLALGIFPVAFTRPTRFMMLQPRGNINTATLLTVAGYPNVGNATTNVVGTMWAHSNRLRVTNVTATHLTYPIDTTVGQSGSPLWLLGNDGIRLALGVHTNGGSANSGVRITCDVIRWIERECAAASVTGPVVDQVAMRASCPAP